MTKFLTLLLACISCVGALDIAFDELYCNKSLPVYATAGDVQMTCNDEQSTRCSFGQDVSLRGSLQYHGLSDSDYNGTGYASANLKLVSVEYSLFNDFPIDFCGDWAQASNRTDDETECPALDGYYYFNIPYTLPFDNDDLTTWFATGWSGVSDLQVRTDDADDSPLLMDCELHWHTYVSPSNADGWKTMPSAAQAGIILGSILVAIFCCCTWMTCCRKRRRHVTDISYYNDMEDVEVSIAPKSKRKRFEKISISRKSKNSIERKSLTIDNTERGIDSVEASRI